MLVAWVQCVEASFSMDTKSTVHFLQLKLCRMRNSRNEMAAAQWHRSNSLADVHFSYLYCKCLCLGVSQRNSTDVLRTLHNAVTAMSSW
jgi:hypothetical protein